MTRFFSLLLCALLLMGCSEMGAKSILEMEMTANYDTSDPFVNEKLIYVSEDVDVLELGASFQMKGESGLLEIADNETKEVVWSKRWDESVELNNYLIALDSLEKDKEYVIRFTGTKIQYAKLVITSESKLVKERERPQKPNKG